MPKFHPTPVAKRAISEKKHKLDLDSLLTQVVGLMVRHRPEELTFSRVSRLIKVPRSTLYYYFGNSIHKMLEEAAQFGMKAFVMLYQIDKSVRYDDWRSFQRARLASVIHIIKKYPWAPDFYFRYRSDEGTIGQSIRDVEERYIQKMSEAFLRFEKTKPTLRSVRLASYMKIGLLFGFSQDSDMWFGKDATDAPSLEKLVDHLTDIVNSTMKARF